MSKKWAVILTVTVNKKKPEETNSICFANNYVVFLITSIDQINENITKVSFMIFKLKNRVI